MLVSRAKIKLCRLEQGAEMRNTRKPMVIMTSQAPLVTMVTNLRLRLKKFSRNLLMKKKTVQTVPIRAFLTVDSVENHLLSGRYCRFMFVPTCHTSRITVVTAPSPLTIPMSCACTLSFTLARSHSSADIVLDHSLERQRYTTTCARIPAKSHFRAKDVERLLPRPRSCTSTRGYQGTVFHLTACMINVS